MASHPSWSPDGSLLAFVADGDIEIVRADGSGRRRVAVSGVEGGRTVPTWTPDGKRLVFWARRGGREGLWSVRLDGGGLRPFGYVGLEDNPVAVSWSPDGRWVGLGTLPGATGVTSGTPMGASASPLPTKAYIGPAGSDRTFIIASLGTVPRWRPSTG
jgi:dipeptidyl aminopeptidase/acylaminoacyl peptidase